MKKINLGRMSYLFIIILLLNQFGYLFGMEDEGQGGAAASSSSSAVEAGAIAEQKQLTPYDFKGIYSPLKDEYKCLSPMLGAVWYSKGIIESMYRCGPDDAVTECVKYWFNLIPGGEFLISKTDTLVLIDIPPVVFGLIAGILFTIKNDATRLKSFMESKDKNASLKNCIQSIITSCHLGKKRRPKKTVELIVDVCKECWKEGSQYYDCIPWVLLTAYLYKKDIEKKDETDRKGLREYFKGVVMAMALERDHVEALGSKVSDVQDSEGLVKDFLNFMEPIKNNQIVILPASAGSLSKLFKNNEEPDWNAQFAHVDKGRFVRDAHSWSTIGSLCENIEEVALLGLQGDLPALESGQKTIKEGPPDCVETALKNMIRIVLYNPETGRINKKKFLPKLISDELSGFLDKSYTTLEAEHFAFGDIVTNEPMVVYANMKFGDKVVRVSSGIDGYVRLGENKLPDGATLTAEGNTKKLTVGSRSYVIAPEEAVVYEVQSHASSIIILMDKLLNLGLFEKKVLAEEFCKVDFVSTYFIAMLEKLGLKNIDAFDMKKLDGALSTYNPPYNIKLCVGNNEEAVFNLNLGPGHGELNSLVPGKFDPTQLEIVFAKFKHFGYLPDSSILYASVANLEREDYWAKNVRKHNVRSQMDIDVPLSELLFMINLHNLGDNESAIECLEKVIELSSGSSWLKGCALRLIDPRRAGDIERESAYPQRLIYFYRDVIHKIYKSMQTPPFYDPTFVSRVSEEAVGAFMSNRDLLDVKEGVADLVCALLSWGNLLEGSINYKKYEVKPKNGKNRVVIPEKCEETSRAKLIEDIKAFIMGLTGLGKDFLEKFWINFFSAEETLLSKDEKNELLDRFFESAGAAHQDEVLACVLAAASHGILMRDGALKLWDKLLRLAGQDRQKIITVAIEAAMAGISNESDLVQARAFDLLDKLLSLAEQDRQRIVAAGINVAKTNIRSYDKDVQAGALRLLNKLLSFDSSKEIITVAREVATTGISSRDEYVQFQVLVVLNKLLDFDSSEKMITVVINAVMAGKNSRDEQVQAGALRLLNKLLSFDSSKEMITVAIDAARAGINSKDEQVKVEALKLMNKLLSLDGQDKQKIITAATEAAATCIRSENERVQTEAFNLLGSLSGRERQTIITAAIEAATTGMGGGNSFIQARAFKLWDKLLSLAGQDRQTIITAATGAATTGMGSKDDRVQAGAFKLWDKLFSLDEQDRQTIITAATRAARDGMGSKDDRVQAGAFKLWDKLFSLDEQDRQTIITAAIEAAATGIGSKDDRVQEGALRLWDKLLSLDSSEKMITVAIEAAATGIGSKDDRVQEGALRLWDKLLSLDSSEKMITVAINAVRAGINSRDEHIQAGALRLLNKILSFDSSKEMITVAINAARAGINSKNEQVKVEALKLLNKLLSLDGQDKQKIIAAAIEVAATCISSEDERVQVEVLKLLNKLFSLDSSKEMITVAIAAVNTVRNRRNEQVIVGVLELLNKLSVKLKELLAAGNQNMPEIISWALSAVRLAMITKEVLELNGALVRLNPPQGIPEAIAAAAKGMGWVGSGVKSAALELWGLLLGLNPPRGIPEAIVAAKSSGFFGTSVRQAELYGLLVRLNPPQGIPEAIAAAKAGLKSKDPEVQTAVNKLAISLLSVLTDINKGSDKVDMAMVEMAMDAAITFGVIEDSLVKATIRAFFTAVPQSILKNVSSKTKEVAKKLLPAEQYAILVQ